jgi:hypothetical protein
MKNSFRPRVEGLEDRMLMNAGGLQAAAPEPESIVFVGGWGASSYQYAFEGTYSRPDSGGGSLTQSPTAADEPLPVLMVIANQDFYYREYADISADDGKIITAENCAW